MSEVKGQLCHCKGKDRASPELMGSPIIHICGNMFKAAPAEETFHTPPGSNLSSQPSSSSVGSTLVETIKELIVMPVENAVAIPVMDPSFIQVRCQRAVYTDSSPKGRASPYLSLPCCCVDSRLPTHRHGSLCLQATADCGEGDV